MNKTINILHWLSVGLLIIIILLLSFGDKIPIEFIEREYRRSFYKIISILIPIVLFFILITTIKINYTKNKKTIIIISTVIGLLASPFIIILIKFVFDYCMWYTSKIHFKKNTKQIVTQYLDCGATGGGMSRYVEIKPFLKHWIIVKDVDKAKISDKEWTRIKE